MKIILNIIKDFRNVFGQFFLKIKNLPRKIKIAIFIIIVLASVIFSVSKDKGQPVALESDTLPKEVVVKSVGELNNASGFSTIGKVEALSEANLQTEAGGRVNGVYVKIGDFVTAGKVIANLQSDIQQASLLQAEGAYEAATVGAVQSSIGVSQSENSVKSVLDNATAAYRNAYNTANNIVLNSLDQFYSNPDSGLIGFRLNGNAQFFNMERTYYRNALDVWQIASLSPLTEENLETKIDASIAEITRLRNLVDALVKVVTMSKETDTLNGKSVSTYSVGLLANEATLNGTLANLNNIKVSYSTALNNRRQANLTGDNGNLSSANAQKKIALGQLRLAQANYEKTFVRSPISGVVNALYLRTGDYVTVGQKAAIIANNNSLQIKTSLNENDTLDLNIGDSVLINDTATGTITAKAGAIDPSNGKVAVVIAVPESDTITNGATVQINFVKNVKNISEIVVPLNSIKLTATGAKVFSVNSDNKLQSINVVLGKIIGENVEVIDGLELESKIVVDARGHKDGESIIVK